MESRNREKKLKRREILEKKKAIDESLRAASAHKDHLTAFPSFRHYERNGLSVHLESGCGDKLSPAEKQYVLNLLKANMEGPYGSEWPAEEKMKRREMVSSEARYIFARELDAPNASASEISKTNFAESKGSIVGFVHFRFCLEEDIAVLYVYELQLESRVQGKGLGKFLMQLIELIARKNRMGAVVLTVQKENLLAVNFYLGKLRYVVSSISPSRVDPFTGVEKSYEILCKVFDNESKALLEE